MHTHIHIAFIEQYSGNLTLIRNLSGVSRRYNQCNLGKIRFFCFLRYQEKKVITALQNKLEGCLYFVEIRTAATFLLRNVRKLFTKRKGECANVLCQESAVYI